MAYFNLSSNWIYRGEGNSSLVLCNTEKKLALRFRKRLKDKGKVQDRDQRNWLSCKDFIDNVMRPLLGDPYVPSPHLITVTEELIKDVNKIYNKCRPEKRKNTEADPNIREVMQLPDLCFIHPWDGLNTNPTFSVELKPKQGFLVPSLKEKCKNEALPTVCKFCLLQRMKIKNGMWTHISRFCPLDIFSGDRCRMHHAMKMLFLTPQNNLRIFKDGNLVFACQEKSEPLLEDFVKLEKHLRPEFGHPGEEVKITSSAEFIKCGTITSFIDAVIAALLSSSRKATSSLSSDDSQDETCFYNTFQDNSIKKRFKSCLPPDCILDRILKAQRLDRTGIDPLYPLYEKVKAFAVQHPEKHNALSLDGPFGLDYMCDPIPEDGPTPTQEDALDIKHCVQKLRQFLVAGTSKDCSIMISLQRLISEERIKPQYSQSIRIVDLDPKPSTRIPKYVQLADEMWKCYRESHQH